MTDVYVCDGIRTPVRIPRRKGDPVVIDKDEHPRSTSLEKLTALRTLFKGGTIIAGNASGINDAFAASSSPPCASYNEQAAN